MQLAKSFSDGLLHLLVLAPFIWLVKQSFEKDDKKYIAVFCLVFLLDSLLVNSLNLSFFDGQRWNWLGKMGSLCWAIIFIYTTKFLIKEDIGWTFRINNWKSVFTIIALFLVARLAIRIFYQGIKGGYNGETFCFEATLPGISEEIVFRGIFLGLLNKIFMPKWVFLKTNVGWGLIITSILFGLVHGLSLNDAWIPDFNSQKFVMTGAMGFAFGLVKEKSKSLLPSILFHNCWNIIAYWGQ